MPPVLTQPFIYTHSSEIFDLNQGSESLMHINAVRAVECPICPFTGHDRQRAYLAMDQHFQAHSIGLKDAKAAYPLVYLHDASISLEEWMRFARRSCREQSDRTGLIAIRDRRGLIHALFGYRIDIDLRARKKLCLGNLVVARMPGQLIDEAIIESANELAARFSCQTISLEQPFSRRTGVPGACPTSYDLLASRISFIPSTRRH